MTRPGIAGRYYVYLNELYWFHFQEPHESYKTVKAGQASTTLSAWAGKGIFCNTNNTVNEMTINLSVCLFTCQETNIILCKQTV